MSHHRNTCTDNASHRIDDFFSAFHLQSVSMTFFHDADSGSKTFHLIALIGTERHIHHHHSTFYTTHHRFCMIDHLVKRDRQCSHVTCHYIGSGIAYKDYVYPRTVHNLRHRVIVGSKH